MHAQNWKKIKERHVQLFNLPFKQIFRLILVARNFDFGCTRSVANLCWIIVNLGYLYCSMAYIGAKKQLVPYRVLP